jgi:redox-sensitive bicupin YhaK (pirin superfamily)
VASSPAFRYGSIAEFANDAVIVPGILAGRARIMKAGRGRERAPLVDSEEETEAPLSSAGEGSVAFIAGSTAERVIAIATVADGRIVHRLRIPQGSMASLASAPDGRMLYYAAAGAVWAISREGGEPRRIATGDGVIATPDGGELIIKLNEMNGSRLVRVAAQGGEPRAVH